MSFEKRMAKRYLAAMKGRTLSGQEQEAAKSARLILSGKGSSEDVNRVRNRTGDHRGVGSKITGAFRRAQNTIGEFTEITDSMAALKAGGKSTVHAEQRLMNLFVKKFEMARNSRTVKIIARTVADKISDDPLLAGRFLKSLGRMARGAGAGAQVVLYGMKAAHEFFDARLQGSRAVSRSTDIARQLNTDPRVSGDMRRRAMDRVQRGDWWIKGQAGNQYTEEFIQHQRAQATEEEIKKEAEAIAAARPALQELGLDPGMVLGEMARRRGKTIGELTSKEINEAVDTAINEKLKNDKNFKREQALYAEREFARRRTNFGYWDPIQSTLDALKTDEMLNAEKDKYKQEYQNRVLKSLPVRMAEREEVAEQVKAERGLNTPAQNFLWEDRMRNARASFHASQSRYRAWMND